MDGNALRVPALTTWPEIPTLVVSALLSSPRDPFCSHSAPVCRLWTRSAVWVLGLISPVLQLRARSSSPKGLPCDRLHRRSIVSHCLPFQFLSLQFMTGLLLFTFDWPPLLLDCNKARSVRGRMSAAPLSPGPRILRAHSGSKPTITISRTGFNIFLCICKKHSCTPSWFSCIVGVFTILYTYRPFRCRRSHRKLPNEVRRLPQEGFLRRGAWRTVAHCPLWLWTAV